MAAKTRTKTRDTSTKEATELLALLSGVLIGLKRKPPGSDAEHSELRESFEKSELGERHVDRCRPGPEGPASVSELAERIGLAPATTSLLVGELSRAGLVQRREDEDDRRRTIVSVDESIEDVVRPYLEETLTPLAAGLDRMSRAQRTHFMEGMRILNDEFGRCAENGSA